jgi:VWFA-related protein
MSSCGTSRLLALLPFGAVLLLAQDPRTGPPAIPTFKSSTRMVLVDVVATDSNGNPVHDLKAGDFTVLDNGKPQSIASFDEQRPDGKPKPAIPLNLPDNVYTNFVSHTELGALTVLLFDSLNTERQDLPNARNKMLNFLRKLPAGRKVALYALSSQLKMVQSFTENSDQLIAAAQQLSIHSHTTYSNTKELSAAIGALRESKISTTPAFGHIVEFLGEEYEDKVELRSQLTLEAFTQLAHALAVVPGRKNLIWLSAGFPFDISGNAPELRKIAALLSATRIAVYPVDVRGVVSLGADAQTSDSELFGQTQPYAMLSGADQENLGIIATMQSIASLTGGRAHINNNDLEGVIADSMQSGSSYYTLAYRPASIEWNGKFHKITLKTSRRDVKLLYRSGYYATSDTSSSTDDPGRVVAMAMQPNAPVSTQLIMKARVVPAKSPGEATRIDILIDVHDLTLAAEKEQKEPNVQFVAVAWDANSKQSASFSEEFRSPLTPAQLESLLRTGLQVHQDILLKAGSYQLRLGVLDRLSGRIGTLDVPLTIRAGVTEK